MSDVMQYLDAGAVLVVVVAAFVRLQQQVRDMRKLMDERDGKQNKDLDGLGHKLNMQGERIARLEGKQNAE